MSRCCRWLAVGSVGLVALILGCSGTTQVAPTTQPEPGPTVEVTVQQVTFKELEIAIQAHKGKIVVLDLWGTFCVPCMREFHNLIEIDRDHKNDGVVCMSTAILAENSVPVLKFLREQKAGFANYQLNDDETRKMNDAWEFAGVPAVMVFDRTGKRIPFTMDDPDNQFTYADVKKKVKELLAK